MTASLPPLPSEIAQEAADGAGVARKISHDQLIEPLFQLITNLVVVGQNEAAQAILTSVLGTVTVALEKQKRIEALEILSTTDPLTGLLNRRGFDERCCRMVREIKVPVDKRRPPTGNILVFILCDIDRFKPYNDDNGHPAGDEALRALGKSLKENIRDALIVRWGGEEFGIACFMDNEKQIPELGKKLLRTVAETVVMASQPDLRCTISGGIACVPRGEDVTFKDLVNRADQELYVAKDNGRNRISISDYCGDARYVLTPDGNMVSYAPLIKVDTTPSLPHLLP